MGIKEELQTIIFPAILWLILMVSPHYGWKLVQKLCKSEPTIAEMKKGRTYTVWENDNPFEITHSRFIKVGNTG